MPNPHKLRAKIETADAKAERDRAAARSKAEKKISKINEELRAEEARIAARAESRRQKAEAKLARVGRSLTANSAGTTRSRYGTARTAKRR